MSEPTAPNDPATPPSSRKQARADERRRRGFVSRIRDSVRKRPGVWLTGAIAAVVLIGSGSAVAIGAANTPGTASAVASATRSPSDTPTGKPSSHAPTATSTATATATPTPTPSATTVARTCSIASPASASGLGAFEGAVMNASTGEVLYSHDGDTPKQTGSVMKTLTTATALATLGGSYRIPTTVTNEGGGTVAIVGHGDPTLSAGGSTVYAGAPTLGQLAQQVKAKLGTGTISRIVTDDSYWSDADAWDATWPVTERTIGYQPEITALMVDGDRANPAAATSPRSTDPAGRAGAAFRTALANAGVAGASSATIVKRATTSTDTIATVSSQPVSTLIGQMIPNSDNTLAEMLARISSKVSGADGSAASLTGVYRTALATYGLDASNITIRDGSGESASNAVAPSFVAKLMIKVQAGTGGLGALASALPVSGESGTLSTRFIGANAVARGKVHAKTGWIDSANTLGGYIDAADGTRLTFAFYAIGSPRTSALPALDTVTTAVYNCGNKLASS